MVKMLFTSFIILCGVFPGAHAQERTALVGGRLIDGFGHAPIHDSVILIYDDTIMTVGTVDTLPVPDGYQVISRGHGYSAWPVGKPCASYAQRPCRLPLLAGNLS